MLEPQGVHCMVIIIVVVINKINGAIFTRALLSSGLQGCWALRLGPPSLRDVSLLQKLLCCSAQCVQMIPYGAAGSWFM